MVSMDRQVKIAERRWLPKADGWALAGLLALAALLYGTFYNVGWLSIDEGYFTAPVAAVQAGAIPNVDFQVNHPGLLYYWHAWLFDLLGPTILATRLGFWGICMVWVGLWYGLCRMLLPVGWSVGTVVLMLLSGPVAAFSSLPSWIGFTLLSGALLALMQWSRTRGNFYPFVAGLLVGVCALFKHSLGVYGGMAAFLAVSAPCMARLQEETSTNAVPWVSSALLLAFFLAMDVLLLRVLALAPDFLAWHGVWLLLPVVVLQVGYWQRRSSLLERLAEAGRPLVALLGGLALPIALAAGVIVSSKGWPGLSLYATRLLVEIPQLFAHGFPNCHCMPVEYILQRGLPPFWLPLAVLASAMFLPQWFWGVLIAAIAVSLSPWAGALNVAPNQVVWSLLIAGPVALRFLSVGVVLGWARGEMRVPGLAALVHRFAEQSPGWRVRWIQLVGFVVLTGWIIFPEATQPYHLYGVSLPILLGASVLYLVSGSSRLLARRALVLAIVLGGLFGVYLTGKQMLRYSGQDGLETNVLGRNTVPLVHQGHAEILTEPQDAKAYQAVLEAIERYSTREDDVLVLPDNPEVYLLAGKRSRFSRYFIYPSQYGAVVPELEVLLRKEKTSVVVLASTQGAFPRIFAAMSFPYKDYQDMAMRIQRRYCQVEATPYFLVFVPKESEACQTPR